MSRSEFNLPEIDFPFDTKEGQVILQQLEQIASQELNIPTLERRNSDSLDFYNVAVWSVKDALIRAFMLGCNGGLPPE